MSSEHIEIELEIDSDCEEYDEHDHILPQRKTQPFMTRFEYAKLLTYRAIQISNGEPPLIDVGNMYCPIEVAKKELEECNLPLVIVRTLQDGTKEYWHPHEMEIIDY